MQHNAVKTGVFTSRPFNKENPTYHVGAGFNSDAVRRNIS